MPCVTVTLPSLLEPVMNGTLEVQAEGASLSEVMRDLIDREPRLRPHLFQESGELRQHVLCFFNGTNTRWLEGEDPPVSEGDTVFFMQAVTGG